MEKKERRKKERRKNGRKKNKSKTFVFDFLNYEDKSWNSGTILYIRIAKGFRL